MTSSEADLLLSNARQSECNVPQVACSLNDKYRRANGTCNNLANPLWGSTYQPLSRQLTPQYGANGDDPHGGLVSTLPSPRHVSLTVHKGGDIDNAEVTHMVAQFGQVSSLTFDFRFICYICNFCIFSSWTMILV